MSDHFVWQRTRINGDQTRRTVTEHRKPGILDEPAVHRDFARAIDSVKLNSSTDTGHSKDTHHVSLGNLH